MCVVVCSHACVHTHTHSPVNPQKCSICSSFSLKGYIQTTNGWATFQCSKASSRILMYPTKETEQKNRYMNGVGPLSLLEIPKSTLLSLQNMNEVSWYGRSTSHHACTCVRCTHLQTFWSAAGQTGWVKSLLLMAPVCR